MNSFNITKPDLNPEQRLSKGIVFYNHGFLQEAEVEFLRILAHDSANANACLAIAMTYFAMAKKNDFDRYSRLTLLYAKKAFMLNPVTHTLQFLIHCHKQIDIDEEFIDNDAMVFTTEQKPVHENLIKALDVLYKQHKQERTQTQTSMHAINNTPPEIPVRDYLNNAANARRKLLFSAITSPAFVPNAQQMTEQEQRQDSTEFVNEASQNSWANIVKQGNRK